MVVRNVYSNIERDREQILRALAIFAGLFGGGLNFAYFTLYVRQGDLGWIYPLGLTLVTVLSMAFTVYVWLEPLWASNHSLGGFFIGALWVLTGFYTLNSEVLDAYGAVQTIMGAVLMGVGMAGVAAMRFVVRESARGARPTRTVKISRKP